jgi:AcrR family transcriptional regulator
VAVAAEAVGDHRQHVGLVVDNHDGSILKHWQTLLAHWLHECASNRIGSRKLPEFRCWPKESGLPRRLWRIIYFTEFDFCQFGECMPREYRMRKRADDWQKTRDRILQATMQLHDEQGVVPTTFADIAKRAGIGQATLYRHFPTPGDLVRTCGGHVWQEMRPPTPDAAPAAFAGLASMPRRLERLVEEIDAFYRRGALRLGLAGRDRALMPELDQFLGAVEAGVEAFVREALAPAGLPERTVAVVVAMMSFPVWQRFSRLGLPEAEFRAFTLRLVQCAMRAARDI